MTAAVKYVVNPSARVEGPRNYSLDLGLVVSALHRSRAIAEQLGAFDVNIFELLGMRNLSAFVGEVFAASLAKEAPGMLVKNPHQDGYPDLLLMDSDGKQAWDRLAARRRDKSPFSPFLTGGFEVKATCGSVPTPEKCSKRGVEKPDLGDQRIALMQGYDWKAHHRETNRLFGLLWDFIDGHPTIVAVFYRDDLTTQDWGKIVQPKANGGRTTSVSIMTRQSVSKMYSGWVVVIDDPRYAQFLDRRHNQALLAAALGSRAPSSGS